MALMVVRDVIMTEEILHLRKSLISQLSQIQEDMIQEYKEYNRINNSFYPDYYSSFGKYQLSAMGEPNGSENFALSFLSLIHIYKKQGYFSKNKLIFKNTPTKTGVLSEKTYNFAPSNQ